MERAFRAFFENSREGMYISTKEGRFVEVNEALCRFLGYTRDELLNTWVEETLALPMERRRFRFEVEANGAVSGFKIKLLSKARDELDSLIDAVALRDKKGEVDGYMGLIRQYRVPHVAASVSERSEESFDLAVRGSNDGLWSWDLKKNKAHYSPRWKSLLGFAPIELSKSINEWFDRIHMDDLVSVKQTLNSYLKGELPVFSSYFRMRNKAGEIQWMLARAVGEFGLDGKCVKLAGSFSNITAHIKVMESLKAQEEKWSQLAASLTSDKAILSRYFSGEMLSAILQGGDPRIRESLGPAALLQIHINRTVGAWAKIGVETYGAFLNEVIVDLMDLVYGHGGSVNKILGDTLLVSFGCPLPQEGDLSQALDCAMEILAYLKTYNDVKPEFLRQELSLSLGLSWGEVFSGTLGSVHRLEYTLVGVPVVRADFLQKTAEKLGLELLVDDRVVEAGSNGAYAFRQAPGAPKGTFTI